MNQSGGPSGNIILRPVKKRYIDELAEVSEDVLPLLSRIDCFCRFFNHDYNNLVIEESLNYILRFVIVSLVGGSGS